MPASVTMQLVSQDTVTKMIMQAPRRIWLNLGPEETKKLGTDVAITKAIGCTLCAPLAH